MANKDNPTAEFPHNRWLDQMPHKPLVWHPIYDLDRKLSKTDVDIAQDIEERVYNRIRLITAHWDESPEVLAKLREVKAWLEERLT